MPAPSAAQAYGDDTFHLDGVAAFVGGTTAGAGVSIILQSDVELRARTSLLAVGAYDSLYDALPLSLLKATLDELLGEALIALEARRLGLASSTDQEVAEARAAVQQAASSDPALRELLGKLGVTVAELEEQAAQRAVVGQFLAANLEGTLDPSDTELSRAFASEDHPFRGEPEATARAHFAVWLRQKRLRDAVSRWVVSLRDRTPYRVLAF